MKIRILFVKDSSLCPRRLRGRNSSRHSINVYKERSHGRNNKKLREQTRCWHKDKRDLIMGKMNRQGVEKEKDLIYSENNGHTNLKGLPSLFRTDEKT